MLPPIFRTLNIPAIQALVGTNPARIYDFGHAPDGTAAPYIVFFQVGGAPHEQISGAPESDTDTVQIDCYAKDRAQIRTLAKAVQTALDAAGQSNRLVVQDYEADTGLYRIGLELAWISSRR